MHCFNFVTLLWMRMTKGKFQQIDFKIQVLLFVEFFLMCVAKLGFSTIGSGKQQIAREPKRWSLTFIISTSFKSCQNKSFLFFPKLKEVFFTQLVISNVFLLWGIKVGRKKKYGKSKLQHSNTYLHIILFRMVKH